MEVAVEVVAGVRLLGDHRLAVSFHDGVRREIDLGPMLAGQVGEVVKPLRDPEFFATVAVDEDSGTIAWPNGADIAPDVLYYGDDGPPPGYYGEDAVMNEAMPLVGRSD